MSDCSNEVMDPAEKVLAFAAERELAARARLDEAAKGAYDAICQIVDERIEAKLNERDKRQADRQRGCFYD